MVRYVLDSSGFLYNKEGKRLNKKLGGTIFLDIHKPCEEGFCGLVPVTAFFTDGGAIRCYVIGAYISIYNRDELYDGRFNSTQAKDNNYGID